MTAHMTSDTTSQHDLRYRHAIDLFAFEIDKLEGDKQAIIAEEQNRYKDNHGLAIFRLGLGQECDAADMSTRLR